MAVVIVKMVEGVEGEKKELLIERLTETMCSVLGKNPETTHIILEETSAENWGFRGRSVSKLMTGK